MKRIKKVLAWGAFLAVGIPFLGQGALGLYSSSKYISPPWGNVLLGIIFLFVVGCGWQVGRVYRRTAKDFKENKRAAAEGVAEAQNSLGVKYREGQGVEQDFKEAFKWFQKAADQGVADAQNNLGVMYAEGLGVEQDFKEAVKWYQKAANQGNALAQNNLGVAYGIDKGTGKGMEQNYVTAYAWASIAAANGFEIAKAKELVNEMIKKNPKLLNKK